MQCRQRKAHACKKEKYSQNCRCTRQSVCSPARGKQSTKSAAATAAANTQRATFGWLQQYGDDKCHRNYELNNNQNGLHRKKALLRLGKGSGPLSYPKGEPKERLCKALTAAAQNLRPARTGF